MSSCAEHSASSSVAAPEQADGLVDGVVDLGKAVLDIA
ncbi:hypothetical protein FHU36_003546 [Nonomuraea muscovyensis]|uniref:Uncharacterized protein n=1 Tax=Nonomuraea muscovyensis TaxID=1124761 RepID=A0A7X0EZR6_9ACTN|nr:hypothetical protein [Nonomuraea muscovyensis]